MSREAIRKYYDIGPAAIATTNVYAGGATGYTTGVSDINNGLGANAWVTGLSQSDDDQGRVGQSINVETLDVRLKISWDLLTPVGATQTLRFVIFADNELDGAAPTFTELFGPTATSVATGSVMSFLNPSYFGRFRIIADRFFTNSQNGGLIVSNSPQVLLHEEHHDLKGHRVMWDTTNSSAIGNARKGHIFLLFIYEQTIVAAGGIITSTSANPPGVQFTTRIRYVDTQSA